MANSPTYKSGVYLTTYGNTCEYDPNNVNAYDVDMAEEIPLEFVDFSQFIRELD